jgi:predicted DNA-binding protein
MSKAKATGPKKPKPAAKGIRHARLELDDEDYQRLKRVAKANGLAVAAYIRQAVLKQIRRDESEGEGGR